MYKEGLDDIYKIESPLIFFHILFNFNFGFNFTFHFQKWKHIAD